MEGRRGTLGKIGRMTGAEWKAACTQRRDLMAQQTAGPEVNGMIQTLKPVERPLTKGVEASVSTPATSSVEGQTLGPKPRVAGRWG